MAGKCSQSQLTRFSKAAPICRRSLTLSYHASSSAKPRQTPAPTQQHYSCIPLASLYPKPTSETQRQWTPNLQKPHTTSTALSNNGGETNPTEDTHSNPGPHSLSQLCTGVAPSMELESTCNDRVKIRRTTRAESWSREKSETLARLRRIVCSPSFSSSCCMLRCERDDEGVKPNANMFHCCTALSPENNLTSYIYTTNCSSGTCEEMQRACWGNTVIIEWHFDRGMWVVTGSILNFGEG